MAGLEDALTYLKQGQREVRFSDNFLAKPEVLSWIFQAVYAASASDALSYDQYAERKKLGDYIYKGGSNDDLPDRSQTISAVKLVYRHFHQ